MHRPQRALRVSLLGVSIPLLLVAFAAARPAPAGPDSAAAAEDESQGLFTLAPPNRNWRPIVPAELHRTLPAAIAGMAGIGSVRCALKVEQTMRSDLEQAVLELLDAQRLDLETRGFLEASTVQSRRAAHGLVSGKRDGKWWRYYALVFRDGKQMYSLLAWGRSEEVPADGSSLQEAALGLKQLGADGEPAAQRRIADADGVGWRVREGRYQDAALGFELVPRGSWRVALGDELAGLATGIRAGLVNDQLEASLGLIIERVPDLDRRQLASLRRRQAAQTGHVTGSRRAAVAGQEIELQVSTLPLFAGGRTLTLRLLHGVLFEGERCVQLFVRYPTDVEATVDKTLSQALSCVRLMDEPRRLELATELQASASPREVLGDGWVLRDGEYVNFALGLRWSVPPGSWEVVPVASAPRATSGVLLALLNHELGVRGWVSVAPAVEGEALARRHALELTRLLGELPERPPTTPEDVQLGQTAGLVSLCDPVVGAAPVRVLLATAVAGRHAFTVRFEGVPKILERSQETLLEVLGALELSPSPIARSEALGGEYRDYRLGFELKSPVADWLFLERRLDHFGPDARPAQGVLAGFEAPGGHGLYAAAIWSSDPLPTLDAPLATLVPSPFAAQVRLPEGAPQRDQRATFRGEPGRVVGWDDGQRRLELLFLRRRATLFVVGAVSGPDDPAPRERLAAFRVLE